MSIQSQVQIVGTPMGSWHAVADALVNRLAPAERGDVVVDGLASGSRLVLNPGQVPRYLVFFEAPNVTDIPPGEVESVVGNWIDAARNLLQHLQRHPTECVAVLVDESFGAFDDLVSLVATRFGLRLDEQASESRELELVDGNALHRLLSNHALEADTIAGPLMEELRHSCVVLSRVPASGRGTTLGIASALAGLHRLEAETLEARREAAEHVRMSGRLQANAAALTAELAHLRDEHSAAMRGFSELRAENELLLLQLQQQHNEQERRAPSVDKAVSAAVAGLEPIVVDKIVLGGARNEPPHREIGLTMLGLRIGTQQIGELGLRLVEHNGHAGLVIFASAVRPLAAWSETGIDYGQSFMLLVPADASSKVRLQNFSASDWRRLQSLAHVIEQGVVSAVADARWILIAKRFAQELSELPVELRFDNISIAPKPDSDVWEIALEGLDLDGLWLQRVNLQWTPLRHRERVRAGQLQILMPKPLGLAGVPFATWPLSESGQPMESVTLSLGSEVSRETRRQEWSSLSPTDRGFVIGLLRTLDRLASGSIPGTTGKTLHAAFDSVLRSAAPDVERSLHVSPWRRFIRRMARTLRSASPRAP